MKMKKLGLLVAVVASFGVATPALAESPFDKSDRLCRTNTNFSCAAAISGPRTTVGDIVKEWGYPLNHLIAVNGWTKGEVTMNTVIPKGKKFVLTQTKQVIPSWLDSSMKF